MKKLLKELENEGQFAPHCIVRYLKRNNYLNVSEILKHLENLEQLGYKYPILIDALYQFYDLFAVELFQLHCLTLKRERSDRKFCAKHSNSSKKFGYCQKYDLV
jgi:hypothetical protein